jgi:hypothetical protein
MGSFVITSVKRPHPGSEAPRVLSDHKHPNDRIPGADLGSF